jgi:sulfite reductase (NADPH) hemoprotein beta-component
MGLEVFKAEVENMLGYTLQPARSYAFDRNVDDFGWVTGQDGKHHFTLFIENGRIQDEPGKNFKTGMKEIAKVHKGTFRLTANQHLIITDVATSDLSLIKGLLAKYRLDNLSQSGLRLSSSACVAFPTCGKSMSRSADITFHSLNYAGLAMAESERVRAHDVTCYLSSLMLIFAVPTDTH